jgi:hypothetical protein
MVRGVMSAASAKAQRNEVDDGDLQALGHGRRLGERCGVLAYISWDLFLAQRGCRTVAGSLEAYGIESALRKPDALYSVV